MLHSYPKYKNYSLPTFGDRAMHVTVQKGISLCHEIFHNKKNLFVERAGVSLQYDVTSWQYVNCKKKQIKKDFLSSESIIHW